MMAAALCSVGCADRAVFVCRSSAQCDVGDGAFCQPSGSCSVADVSCASGHRVVDHAPDGEAGQCVPGDVVTELALRLSFEEASGLVVEDDSPARLDGIMLNGVTRIEDGPLGRAIQLDGAAGRVEVRGDSTVFGDGEISAFAWVRSRDTDSQQNRIIGRGFADDGSYFWINFGAGRPGLESHDSTGAVIAAGGPDLDVDDDAWHHVGFVLDRELNEFRFYVDGFAFTSRPDVPIGSYGSDDQISPFFIGGENAVPALSIDGDIDEVWVFRRALAETDVQLLYSAALP